jgi:hypothetical protein
MSEAPIYGYREAAQRAGVELKLGEDLCLGVSFHLADTQEKAIREATPFYEEYVKMFGPLGFVRGLTPEQLVAIGRRGGWAEARIPTLEDAVKAGSWYCGPPEGFINFLKGLEEKYPGLEEDYPGAVGLVCQGSDAGVQSNTRNTSGGRSLDRFALGYALSPPSPQRVRVACR